MTDPITAAVEDMFADIDSVYERAQRRIGKRENCPRCKGKGLERELWSVARTLVKCTRCDGTGKQ